MISLYANKIGLSISEMVPIARFEIQWATHRGLLSNLEEAKRIAAGPNGTEDVDSLLRPVVVAFGENGYYEIVA